MSRLRSTGRSPSVDLGTLRTLLTRYFSEDHPSVAELSSEAGLCQATCRKYLRLGLGHSLPRGKAALLSRGEANVQALVNAVPTVDLLGSGRMELLARRRGDGAGVDALAREFGISRKRVKAVLAELDA